MSISDSLRLLSLEATVATLVERLAALEEMVADIRAFCEARHPSAPADDAMAADVVEALEAGQSIRRAANMLGLDRNKVARLRQRAIAEGRLLSRPTKTSAPPPEGVRAP